MRNGLIRSLVLHVVLFTLIYVGLPSFLDTSMNQEQIITVELLTVSEITNVKPRKVTPKAKPEVEEKKEIIAAVEPKKSLPDPTRKPVVEPEPAPTPVVKKKPELKKEKKEEVAVKPVQKPKPEPKAPEVKEKPKPKKEEIPEDSFASVLKSVEEFKVSDEPKKQDDTSKEADFSQVEDFLSNVRDETKYKPGMPLTLNEKDAIRQQIIRNWTVTSGAKGAQDMIVTLKISLSRDGSVNDVNIIDQGRYNNDSFFRATVDSARRAVYKSSPLQNLPPEKYDVKEGWRELVLNFDPSEMFY